ncbi:MAG: hypothetical protein WKF82_10500 [Nocardioidaceae bacterium]
MAGVQRRHHLQVRQHYFLARVPSFEIDNSAFEDYEQTMVTGHRWWTVSELRATTETLRPAGLPELLEQLLTEGPPTQPLVVDG